MACCSCWLTNVDLPSKGFCGSAISDAQDIKSKDEFEKCIFNITSTIPKASWAKYNTPGGGIISRCLIASCNNSKIRHRRRVIIQNLLWISHDQLPLINITLRYTFHASDKVSEDISMAWCEIVMTPFLTHWSYCNLALSYRYSIWLWHLVLPKFWWLMVLMLQMGAYSPHVSQKYLDVVTYRSKLNMWPLHVEAGISPVAV